MLLSQNFEIIFGWYFLLLDCIALLHEVISFTLYCITSPKSLDIVCSIGRISNFVIFVFVIFKLADKKAIDWSNFVENTIFDKKNKAEDREAFIELNWWASCLREEGGKDPLFASSCSLQVSADLLLLEKPANCFFWAFFYPYIQGFCTSVCMDGLGLCGGRQKAAQIKGRHALSPRGHLLSQPVLLLRSVLHF